MKRLAAALAFGMALSGAAFADTMQNAYGNTIVITYADGSVSRYHFNEDGTFSAAMGEANVTGTYEVADGQICLTPAGGERGCTQLIDGKNVGDTWTQTATDGSTITVTLEAGR